MKKDEKNRPSRQKMTPERLRQHLYENTKAKFWDYNPEKLSIGLEIEYFIAHKNEHASHLASQRDYMQVIEHLKNHNGYRDWVLYDQPGRISRDTDIGFVVIKPDFAWHILEVSLPPRNSVNQVAKLLVEVLGEIDEVLAKFGLERLDVSCLSDPPPKMDLVQLDRLGQIADTFMAKKSDQPTIDPAFPAYITATHVHLNVSDELTLGYFPNLYHLDKVISERFNRARTFRGRVYENVRTSLYRDTLGADYLLHTYPEKPATNIEELCEQMNKSPKLFPKDRFFAVRDMSYIRPTSYGTLEFRSCCSYKDPEKVVEIVKWRTAQIMAATSVVSESVSHELATLTKHLQRDSA
jgi:hypothetical protein